MKKLRVILWRFEMRSEMGVVFQSEKDVAQKTPGFLRSIVSSALGSALGRTIVATMAVVSAILAPSAYRTLQTLRSPVPLSGSAQNVASNLPPGPVTNLEAHVDWASPTPICCTAKVGPNTPAAPILRLPKQGVAVLSMVESQPHSDDVTAIVSQGPPTETEVASIAGPNSHLGIRQFSTLADTSWTDLIARTTKITSDPGILTSTGTQALPTQPFDWSKMTSTPSSEEAKAAMDASGIGWSQTGNLQRLSNTGTFSSDSAAQFLIIGADGQLKPIGTSALTGTQPQIVASPSAQ
jgi:hypothetical protein